MVRLSIELPDKLRSRAQARASAAGHDSVETYLQTLLVDDISSGKAGAPDAQRFADAGQLERLLQAGLASGPAVELTDADWSRKRQELIRRRDAVRDVS